MQFSLVLLVCAVPISFVRGEDECMPPKPGEKFIHHGSCCKIEKFLSEDFMTKAKKCHEKYPPPPKPTGPPPAGGPPLEIRNKFACMGECVFTENNLLNSDKQLDKDAIMKTFVASDPKLKPVVQAAVEKCLGLYQELIDQELECKSGSEEFKMCAMREVFLNCPSAQWNDSTECQELKEKTAKCTRMPVMMGMKKPPHH